MTSTSTSSGTVTDLITAGEGLFTAVSGGEVSAKAAANINDAGAVVSLIVSLAARNITAVDVAGIVSGLTTTVTGITEVVTAVKTKTTATTATTAVAADTAKAS